MYLYCDADVPLLFCDNETNNARLFGTPNSSHYLKDGIADLIVHGHNDRVNPKKTGTKAAAHYHLTVPAQGCETIMLRLSKHSPAILDRPFLNCQKIIDERKGDADEFYNGIMPPVMRADADKANIYRQATAGLLWSKQYFYYDLDRWLRDHSAGFHDRMDQTRKVRNRDWYHMYNADVISMPDKWEYPWYAAWDLAFHTLPLSSVDIDFAKEQLDLMLRTSYQHPNGQLPAYEWNFSDVNPPTHAFAVREIYEYDKARNNGKGDTNFLKYAFNKLIINYAWWVNRKDPTGRNIFDGGFLGLDNIGVARHIMERLISLFAMNEEGRRPVFGDAEKFQTDPHWKDNLLFYEYFHGDNGSGLGASHQTGWTALISRILRVDTMVTEEMLLSEGGLSLMRSALMSHFTHEQQPGSHDESLI